MVTDDVDFKPFTVLPRARPSLALRWDGSHLMAEQIARHTNGRIIVVYVPGGYLHPLRSADEQIGTSVAFLVVYRSASSTPFRVDDGTWFVWDDRDGDVEIMPNNEFDRRYILQTGATDDR